eukprot:COSAG01_NODE_15180_length_1364_cov_2.879051_2_plen_177_part_00
MVAGAGGNALRNISHSLWAGWALQANAPGFSSRPFDGGAPARHDFLSPRTNAALTMLDGLAGTGSVDFGGDGGGSGDGAAPAPAAVTQQPASLEGGRGGQRAPALPENAYTRMLGAIDYVRAVRDQDKRQLCRLFETLPSADEYPVRCREQPGTRHSSRKAYGCGWRSWDRKDVES